MFNGTGHSLRFDVPEGWLMLMSYFLISHCRLRRWWDLRKREGKNFSLLKILLHLRWFADTSFLSNLSLRLFFVSIQRIWESPPVKMVRTSVLNDALTCINNAERAGKRQVLIRPSSKVIVKFLSVMQKHGTYWFCCMWYVVLSAGKGTKWECLLGFVAVLGKKREKNTLRVDN
jgi:ribosomal S8-like protein